MGKGGGGDVEYTQSPEQRQIYSEILPIIQMMGEGAKTGMSPWGQLPSAPGPRPYPSMSNFGGYQGGYQGGYPGQGGFGGSSGKGGFGGGGGIGAGGVGNPVWDSLQSRIPGAPTQNQTPVTPSQPPPVDINGARPLGYGAVSREEYLASLQPPAPAAPSTSIDPAVTGHQIMPQPGTGGGGGNFQPPTNIGPSGGQLGGIIGSIIGSPAMSGMGNSGGGVLSGVPGYNIPGYGVGGYNIPNVPGSSGYNVPNVPGSGDYNVPGAVTPSAGWFDNMSPEVKAGMWEPYKEAGNQMLEVMGGRGQGGSPRGGYSGAAGTAMGELFADAGNQVGMNAWQMQQPGLMAEFQGQLGANRDIWGQNASNQMAGWQANIGQNRDVWGQNAANQMEQWRSNVGQNQWQAQGNLDRNQWLAQQNLARNMMERGELQQERMGDYSQSAAYQQGLQNMDATNWQQAVSGRQFPFQMLPGMAGGTYSQGVVPNQSNMMQGVGTGLLAGGGAALAGAGLPLAGLMGLGGLLGGK